MPKLPSLVIATNHTGMMTKVIIEYIFQFVVVCQLST